jgi:diguanylate cyclase (GGDEF)-like protein
MEEAIMKIEKIRRFIETHNFESIGQITASFGLACIKENDNVNTIFARADKALYQAKAQGKNQVSYTE